MTGKTKRFMEDMLIFLIIIVVIAVVYYFTSNFFMDKSNTIKEEEKVSLIQEKKVEDSVDIVKAKDLNATNDKPETKLELENTIEKKVLSNKEKKVDIEKLKQFISHTEEKIAKNVVYNLDKNSSNNEEYLKIRITLLKSGEYEQLKFIEGNENLFEHNKENITKIFPLSIDKEIVEEFPRYLRIELRKKF